MKTLITLAFCLLPFFSFGQALDTASMISQIDSLVKVARTLTDQKQYDAALRIIESAEKKANESLGNNHSAVASCIFNHGRVFQNMGNPVKGIEYYRKAKMVWEGMPLATSYPEYTSCLLNLANLYSEQGYLEDAEPLYLNVKSIRQVSPGKNHPGYTRVLASLGNLYVDMARFEEAEALVQEVKSIQIASFGSKSREYANALNNQGHLYYETGQYFNAETCLLEAKDIYGEILGKNHPEYARILNNLADVYTQLSLFQEGEACQLEALQIWENAFGKKDPLYATWLANLAHLYYLNSDYKKSEPLYLNAKSIQEEFTEKSTPDYLNTINNLAVLYQETDRFVEAELLLNEVKEARRQALGESHLQYGAALLNLGRLYTAMERFGEAGVFLEKSKNIIEASAGKNHLFYQHTLESQVQLLSAIGLGSTSWPTLKEYMDLRRHQLLYASQYLSGQQLGEYIQRFERDLGFFMYHGALCKPEGNQFAGAVFDNMLFYKGLLLSKSDYLKHLASTTPASAQQYGLFVASHRRLANEYSKPLAGRTGVEDMEMRVNRLEKELTRTVAGFGDAIRQVDWQEVQATLQPDEAAIEFVHYRFQNPKTSDSVLYVALVLRPGDKNPHWIRLFEENQLRVMLGKFPPDKEDLINKTYGSNALYDLMWKPIEKWLGGAKRIYYSPSGLLHLLSLEAVVPYESGLSLHRIGSARQLVVGKQAPVSVGRDAVVYGGIRYEMDSISIEKANREGGYESPAPPAYYDRAMNGNLVNGVNPWNFLDWTEIEANIVGDMLTEAGIQVMLRQGYSATEESVYALGKSTDPPKVLHFSTHGFSFPDPVSLGKGRGSNELVFKTSKHPMMRSGLILAGANKAWMGDRPLQGMEDGILTAYEVSQLNLQGTELVVLSACETGLGKIEGNEGIYGLQRAFKMAGAKYLLMSLWQVPDYQTQELMDAFYTQWLKYKKSIPEAFHSAQMHVRAARPEPFYWAGFVLIE